MITNSQIQIKKTKVYLTFFFRIMYHPQLTSICNKCAQLYSLPLLPRHFVPLHSCTLPHCLQLVVLFTHQTSISSTSTLLMSWYSNSCSCVHYCICKGTTQIQLLQRVFRLMLTICESLFIQPIMCHSGMV